MRRFGLAAAVVLVLVVVVVGQARAGLVNSGFESGDFGGWSAGGANGGFGVGADGLTFNTIFGPMAVTARSGQYAAYALVGGTSGEYLMLTQTVVLAAGTYDVGYYLGTDRLSAPGSGFGSVDLNKILIDGVSYTLTDKPDFVPGDGSLARFATQFTTSGGSTQIQFRATASGARALISVDDAFLTPAAVPEPSTLISGGIACLLGLGYGWRRRKARAAA